MSVSQDVFDPLAIVVDWLDACRAGDLKQLLAFYDERATLECECDGVTVAGRPSIGAYWALKLEIRTTSAFTLEDVTLTGDGVRLDYQDYEGKPVRIHFRFNPSGKILHTSCAPLGRSCAA